MSVELIAKGACAELHKKGFNVRANDDDRVAQVEVNLPGYLAIVSAENPSVTRAWLWRKYGEGVDDLDRNTLSESKVCLSGDPKAERVRVKSMLLAFRKLLAGCLDKVMADHVKHVNEQADLGKGGMTEEEMAAIGLLDIDTINMLNESVAKVEAALADYSAKPGNAEARLKGRRKKTMGLDLDLIPIHHHDGMTWWLGRACIPLDRDGLGHMICGQDDDGSKPVKTHPIPKNVHLDLYQDDGVKRTTEDSYGSKLEYATAGDLAKSMIGYAKKQEFNPWNEAAIAFISALPPETPVVLYWH